MWLRRTKSKVQNRSAVPHLFACSSFKDIQLLLSDDKTGEVGVGDVLNSPIKTAIGHRISRVTSLRRTPPQIPIPENEAVPEEPVPGIHIPGPEKSIVVYFTSLRVVRSTFEDCKDVLAILRAFRVSVDERDLSMDSQFTDELQRILGQSDKSKLILPRVFIGGRYIGGAEEVQRLHESGELKKYVEGLPLVEPCTCKTCGGYRFILCVECRGSHKCYREKAGFRSCTFCNENGLIRCPSCSCAPL